jgi:hypothetical protein
MTVVADTDSIVSDSDPTEPVNPLYDPLQPFTAGGPAVELPVTADDLTRALSYLLDHFPDNDTMAKRAKKAHAALVSSAKEEADQLTWSVEPNGMFVIAGSNGTYYTVTDSECYKRGVSKPKAKGGGRTLVYCQGWLYSGHMCYHVVARELVRLAQVLCYGAETATADEYHTLMAEAGDELAMVFVSISKLRSTLEALITPDSAQFLTLAWSEVDSTLRLRSGTTSTFIDGQGGGHASLNVEAHALQHHIGPAVAAEDEDECALRFGTASMITIITEHTIANLRGAHPA